MEARPWLLIMQSLRKAFVTYGAAGKIMLGHELPESAGNVPDGGEICIVRDREIDDTQSLYHSGEGSSYFYLHLYVGWFAKDEVKAYENLSALEGRVLEALSAWADDPPMDELQMDIGLTKILECTGDLDALRPVLGSRLHIQIDWSKRTY